jgi:hypothetical protein
MLKELLQQLARNLAVSMMKDIDERFDALEASKCGWRDNSLRLRTQVTDRRIIIAPKPRSSC